MVSTFRRAMDQEPMFTTNGPSFNMSGGFAGGGRGFPNAMPTRVTPRTGAGYQRPSARNPEKLEQWLNDKAIGEMYWLEQDADPVGYYGSRSRWYDTQADDAFGTYQDRMDNLYNDEAPDGGQWQFNEAEPSVQRPTDPGFSFAGYDDWLGQSGDRFGSFEEGDLTSFSDPNSYFKASVPGIDKILGMGDVPAVDFAGAFDKYSKGAAGLFTQSLRRQHDDLLDSAAGGNRLKTGFYDEDVGRLETDLSRQFNDQAMAKALEVAALEGQDADSRRRTGVDRGRTALDAANLSLDAGKAAASAAIKRAENARANRLSARQAYESDRDTGRAWYEDSRDTGREWYESDRDAAETRFQDRRDFSRGAFEKDRTFQTDRYRDTRDSRIDIAGRQLDASGKMSDTAYDRFEGQRDRYYDWLAGTTDRVTGNANAKRKRKSDFWGNVIGGAVKIGTALL